MTEAVCRDISTPQVIVTDDDLGLMNNSSDDCVVKSVERNDHLLADFTKYHSKKRNSSFSEYFEGDLSQNLLSRKHFQRRDSELANDTVNAIVSRIREEDYHWLTLNVGNKFTSFSFSFSIFCPSFHQTGSSATLKRIKE